MTSVGYPGHSPSVSQDLKAVMTWSINSPPSARWSGWASKTAPR